MASRAPIRESSRPTVYTEAMEVFHRAADLIGLDRRVRMELEEPDYEHIFYVTVKLHTRLSPLTQDQDKFRDLAESELLPDGLEPLLDGSFVFKRRALIGAHLAMRDGVVRLKGKGLYKVVPGRPERFKAYRVQHNQARGPYKGG
ncbi:MAG TPA: Glu/Leu/Phe/Val dehydrogenase, partial [Myxococcales bacterium]